MSSLFAATYPARTLALVLFGAAPRFVCAPDYPRARTREESERRIAELESRWGTEDFFDVRAGLHIGECEVIDGKVGGIAVHIGARVASQAGAGEVIVSSTVRDLVAGSGIGFSEHGVAELKGIPGEWRLFAVER